jgi:ABC-type Zn uptake system ZnuABC Zn-binding protein ZnuA
MDEKKIKNVAVSVSIVVIVLLISIFGITFLLLNYSESTDSIGSLKIVTTIAPLTYLTQEIVSSDDKIKTLAANEAHDYELTPQDIIAINDADVLISTGLDLDSFIEEIDSQIDNQDLIKVEATDFIETIDADPHFWMSKSQSINFVTGLTEVFVNSLPNKVDTNKFQSNLSNFESRINEITSRVDFTSCELTTIFVEHNAFIYLSRENNFDIVSLSNSESSDDSIDPASFASFIDSIKKSNSKYIYIESEDDDSLNQVATDNNLSTLVLDTMESYDPQKNFFDIYDQNFNQLKTGLSC